MKRNQTVALDKYFKRIITLMSTKNPEKASSFKKLILEATHAEKNYKENARKTKEKDSSD